MSPIEDRDFFDELFQGWTKTTWAEDAYWMPQERDDGRFDIYAVRQKDAESDPEMKLVASHLLDEDASFTTALHGCFADLVRRLHEALDEADAKDYDRDSRECRIAELELENEELRKDK